VHMKRPRLNRAQAFVVMPASWLLIFGMLPVAIGRRRSHRYGLGLGGVAFGAAGLMWCLAEHLDPEETIAVSLVPEHLLAKGPYRFSRNPMYVCEGSILLGWSVYFGSPTLLAVLAAFVGGTNYAVRREERTLRVQFGDRWEEYASRVPRWVRGLG
jgi:protein-S-isoprenylcysteine O-methyltransferase Ste14